MNYLQNEFINEETHENKDILVPFKKKDRDARVHDIRAPSETAFLRL